MSENPGIFSKAVPRSITTPSFKTEFSPLLFLIEQT